ncbi:hypothetical protein GEMRC1_008529 [Eukaryota sp. GEM-RC1]
MSSHSNVIDLLKNIAEEQGLELSSDSSVHMEHHRSPTKTRQKIRYFSLSCFSSILIVLLLSAILALLFVQYYSSIYVVRGTIFNILDNTPVVDASIILSSDSKSFTSVSSPNGFFRLSELPRALYNLTVIHPEFFSTSRFLVIDRDLPRDHEWTSFGLQSYNSTVRGFVIRSDDHSHVADVDVSTGGVLIGKSDEYGYFHALFEGFDADQVEVSNHLVENVLVSGVGETLMYTVFVS